jgi:hypothetical protein
MYKNGRISFLRRGVENPSPVSADECRIKARTHPDLSWVQKILARRTANPGSAAVLDSVDFAHDSCRTPVVWRVRGQPFVGHQWDRIAWHLSTQNNRGSLHKWLAPMQNFVFGARNDLIYLWELFPMRILQWCPPKSKLKHIQSMESQDTAWKWTSFVLIHFLRSLLVWKQEVTIFYKQQDALEKLNYNLKKNRALIHLSAQKAEEEMQFVLGDLQHYEVH